MKYIENYIERKNSCLTGGNDFKSVVKIKEFPVFFGVTNNPQEEDLYAIMEWFMEKETGLIQLNSLIPLDILYQEQHAYGFGETWEAHYQEFSSFLKKTSPKNVLEIGGGQGRIAKICESFENIQKWTIVEPNPTITATDKIHIIQGFFDKDFEIKEGFDTFTFSHVLEHAYDPREFLESIFRKMDVGDDLVFSYPNLEAWLSKKYTNSLNFEHTIFLNFDHLTTLLKNIGFKIVRQVDYLEHSHFFHVVKREENPVIELFNNQCVNNERLLLNFVEYHHEEVRLLNEKINEFSDRPIYLFGAHIFSQYLKVFGLKTEGIVSILDNSIEKQGKRLYGTDLYVESPYTLEGIENPVIILRAGPYNVEIKDQVLNRINSNVVFI